MMKTRPFFLLFLLVIPGVAVSQDSTFLTSYTVGETNVMIHARRFAPGLPGVTFINLHDNEQTSVKAAENYLQACGGGTLVRISNQQERFIDICLSGQEYRFDPNRIYSPSGRKYTLTKLSEVFNYDVQSEVAYLANEILRTHLDGTKLVVAIHNNTDSLLSVVSYLQDQSARKHFGKVFINPDMDPDDFMLTTDSSLFRKIMEKNINVVWENSKLTPDDGSLSLYAGMHEIPYINIEAEHEHFDEQLRMLNALDDIIKEYGQKTDTVENHRDASHTGRKSSLKRSRYK